MFERIISLVNNENVVTKFEKCSAKRDLPVAVKRQVDNKFFDIYYIYQLFSCFIKNKDIIPNGKLRFGKIVLRTAKNGLIDEQLKIGNQYYGWQINCIKKGNKNYQILIILGELSEAMAIFQQSKTKKKED